MKRAGKWDPREASYRANSPRKTQCHMAICHMYINKSTTSRTCQTKHNQTHPRRRKLILRRGPASLVLFLLAIFDRTPKLLHTSGLAAHKACRSCALSSMSPRLNGLFRFCTKSRRTKFAWKLALRARLGRNCGTMPSTISWNILKHQVLKETSSKWKTTPGQKIRSNLFDVRPRIPLNHDCAIDPKRRRPSQDCLSGPFCSPKHSGHTWGLLR